MKKNTLGQTGIQVTELCFGALPMGPLQANKDLNENAKLIRQGLEKGINFIDTAELYQTHEHIKKALNGYQGEVIIATKSTAESYEEMEKSINCALEALGRDYIDIFHLHAAKATAKVFEERAGALQCLKDYKDKKIIKAIGISSHAVEVIEAAADKTDIDVVFPIMNKLGMGIIGGTVEDMLKAIDKVAKAGKGLYAMKALAGGHMIDQIKEAFDFVREIPAFSSIAVGMVSEKEINFNLKIFNDQPIPVEDYPEKEKSKSLIISFLCKGCGTCVKVCPNSALRIENGKAVVDKNVCLLCGYCSPACPEFALRLA